MAKFPVDAPKRRVIRAFELLGFYVVREREHIVMARDNQDGTQTPLVMPNQPQRTANFNDDGLKYMLARSKPEAAKKLLKEAQGDVSTRWAMYEYLAARHLESHNGHGNGNGKGVSEGQETASQVK